MSAAQALRAASSSIRTPQESIEYDRELAGLRAGMEEKTFNSLWEEGQAMNLEQAVDFALDESEQ